MMQPTSNQLRPKTPPHGFSIVEILFAVMILGIGFIMVAAMLPVGIQQTRATVDEVTGRSLAKSTAMRINAIMRSIPAPDPTLGTPTDRFTGPIQTTTSTIIPDFQRGYNLSTGPAITRYRHQQISTELLNSDRYGATFLYSSDRQIAATPGTLDIIAIALRLDDAPYLQSVYSGYYGWHATYDNASIPCSIIITKSIITGSPVTVKFDSANANYPQAVQAAVEDGVCIIQTDTALLNNYSRYVFHLGNRVEDGSSDTWEVSKITDSAGGVPSLASGTTKTLNCYLIGRSLQNPQLAWNTTTNPRTGLSMVIAVESIHDSNY